MMRYDSPSTQENIATQHILERIVATKTGRFAIHGTIRQAFWLYMRSIEHNVLARVAWLRLRTGATLLERGLVMMPAHGEKDVIVWVISDGKIGDDVQCQAVAASLSADFQQKLIAPHAPWVWTAPWGVIDPRDHPSNPNSPIAPPFPDVIVASGRRAVPYARRVKRESGGKTLVVFLKNPRAGFSGIDVIWAPDHDRLSGPNIFSTLTSPHGLGPKLAEANTTPLHEIAALEKPMLGVVLGGTGGGAFYDASVARDFAAKIKNAAASYASVAVTPSRRTPDFLLAEVRETLRDQNAFVWDGVGNNPYIDILANADALVVTADSHNMMSETLATGVGVYVYHPPRLADKLKWFVGQLEKSNTVRRFEGSAEQFSGDAKNATGEIVAEIKRRLSLIET